jgi:hypothetical protein
MFFLSFLFKLKRLLLAAKNKSLSSCKSVAFEVLANSVTILTLLNEEDDNFIRYTVFCFTVNAACEEKFRFAAGEA